MSESGLSARHEAISAKGLKARHVSASGLSARHEAISAKGLEARYVSESER
ncbi:MAG: hypothetical protein Q4E41_07700 [Bacteroidales bacterium]|nr:hypothetical protein [Bacteroidales bacterium]